VSGFFAQYLKILRRIGAITANYFICKQDIQILGSFMREISLMQGEEGEKSGNWVNVTPWKIIG